MTCIKFTRNVVVTPLQWGEPVVLERNVTVTFPRSPPEDNDDSKDDCQVSSFGELRFAAEEADENPTLLKSTGRSSWFGIFSNVRILLKSTIDLDLSVGFNQDSLSNLALGLNLLGMQSVAPDPAQPPMSRGFLADNLHLVTNCDGKDFNVSLSP